MNTKFFYADELLFCQNLLNAEENSSREEINQFLQYIDEESIYLDVDDEQMGILIERDKGVTMCYKKDADYFAKIYEDITIFDVKLEENNGIYKMIPIIMDFKKPFVLEIYTCEPLFFALCRNHILPLDKYEIMHLNFRETDTQDSNIKKMVKQRIKEEDFFDPFEEYGELYCATGTNSISLWDTVLKVYTKCGLEELLNSDIKDKSFLDYFSELLALSDSIALHPSARAVCMWHKENYKNTLRLYLTALNAREHLFASESELCCKYKEYISNNSSSGIWAALTLANFRKHGLLEYWNKVEPDVLAITATSREDFLFQLSAAMIGQVKNYYKEKNGKTIYTISTKVFEKLLKYNIRSIRKGVSMNTIEGSNFFDVEIHKIMYEYTEKNECLRMVLQKIPQVYVENIKKIQETPTLDVLYALLVKSKDK